MVFLVGRKEWKRIQNRMIYKFQKQKNCMIRGITRVCRVHIIFYVVVVHYTIHLKSNLPITIIFYVVVDFTIYYHNILCLSLIATWQPPKMLTLTKT